MKKSKINQERSEAMQTANQPVKKGFTFKRAINIAWSAIRLKRLMKKEVVRITYLRKDGTFAERTATLKADFLPVRKSPTAQKKRTSEKVTYFELSENVNGFKSFLPQNLICYSIVKQTKTAKLSRISKAA